MSPTMTIYNITRTSVDVYIEEDGIGVQLAFKIYASDGTTVIKTISDSDPGWSGSTITVIGLDPGTSYIAKLDDYPSVQRTFTTRPDDPKVATESMWEDLASKVKAKADATSVPIMDYSTNEVDTGAKWVDGSSIYKKTINTGALPDSDKKTVAHGITGLSKIIKIEGYTYNSTDSQFFPFPFASALAPENNIGVWIEGADIGIRTGTDRTRCTESYVTLYYTKSS